MVPLLPLCIALVAGQPPDLAIDLRQDGAAIPAVIGQRITIRLPCRPGTGYSWHESASGDDVLVEREDSRFEPLPENEGKEDKEGGPELHVFRYVTKKPGTAKFTAIHARPHRSRSKILGSFEVTIKVGENR
jgi:predicted secreted protein